MGEGLEPIFAACGCCFFTTSIIFFIVNLAMKTDDIPAQLNMTNMTNMTNPTTLAFGHLPLGHDSDVSPAFISCGWELEIDDQSYRMYCGNECKYACGLCDTVEDGCVGIKYCRLSCPIGARCNRTVDRGDQSRCHGICGLNNTCIETPEVDCQQEEKLFHGVLDLGCIIAIVCSILCYVREETIPKSKGRFGFWSFMIGIPAACMLIISFSFTVTCLASGSRWKAAGITYIVFVVSVVLYCIGYLVSSLVNEESSKVSVGVLGTLFWVAVSVVTAPLCFIMSTNTKSIYWYNEDPYEGIAEDFRCSNTESAFYAFWAAMALLSFFGLSTCYVGWPELSKANPPEEYDLLGCLIAATYCFFYVAIACVHTCEKAGTTQLKMFGGGMTFFAFIFTIGTFVLWVISFKANRRAALVVATDANPEISSESVDSPQSKSVSPPTNPTAVAKLMCTRRHLSLGIPVVIGMYYCGVMYSALILYRSGDISQF